MLGAASGDRFTGLESGALGDQRLPQQWRKSGVSGGWTSPGCAVPWCSLKLRHEVCLGKYVNI